MNKQMSWSARLLIGLVLIIVGAGAATWGLAHYQPAARFLGVAPVTKPIALVTPKPVVPNPAAAQLMAQPEADNARIAGLEARLGRAGRGAGGRSAARHPSRALQRGVAALVDRGGRRGAGRTHAPSRSGEGGRLGRKGPPLRRRAPRPRRNRVGGIARRPQPRWLNAYKSPWQGDSGMRISPCAAQPGFSRGARNNWNRARVSGALRS